MVPRAGDVSIRVVEGEPGRSRIYRLSQFVAVGVERRLWITDPYFVAPPAMSEALAAAARDNVDVRILVPAYNNWPVVGGFSRAGYRPLLEAGVRVFEWEGPMIHAKTAVADGIWTRIGSSNLNLASLLSNWELDVAILDRSVGAVMEEVFLRDLASSVEVGLPSQRADKSRRSLVREPVTEIGGQRLEGNIGAAREARRRARRGSPVGPGGQPRGARQYRAHPRLAGSAERRSRGSRVDDRDCPPPDGSGGRRFCLSSFSRLASRVCSGLGRYREHVPRVFGQSQRVRPLLI